MPTEEITINTEEKKLTPQVEESKKKDDNGPDIIGFELI